MNPFTATLIAVAVSLTLIAAGLWLTLRGRQEGGGTLSAAGVKIEGGPGIVLVTLGLIGLGLTAWWDFDDQMKPDADPLTNDTPNEGPLDYELWLEGELNWCAEIGWDVDPTYCAEIEAEAYG